MLSSHLLGDLERVCDHLIVLADVAGPARRRRRRPARRPLPDHRYGSHGLPAGAEVIHADHTASGATVIVRSTDPIPGADHADLEDVGLAYMTRAAETAVHGSAVTALEAQR